MKLISRKEASKIYEQGKKSVTDFIIRISADNARLTQENTLLRDKLELNSGNSSLPPSSDRPETKPARKSTPSGKTPGGQPGHKGHSKELLPIEKVDKIFDIYPEFCRDCNNKLSGQDPIPFRRQFFEIPEPKIFITEYRIHTLECPCGCKTKGLIPDELKGSSFGPRLQSTAAILSGVYHLSKRQISQLMKDFFGVEISSGSICAAEEAVGLSLKEIYEEAVAFVNEQNIKYADETGWREARRKAWLWCIVTEFVTIFMIHPKRGKDAAMSLLNIIKGILVSDRWGAYNFWPREHHQICWAHLKRHFKAFSEYHGGAGRLGLQLLGEVKKMFRLWLKVRDGTITRSQFKLKMNPIQNRIRELLSSGSTNSHPKVSSVCKQILKLEECLWVFVDEIGVEPTNNKAERAVRKGVIWRKISYGTHSDQGSRFVERILTVSESLNQQNRNILEFVYSAHTANMYNKQRPSLIPALEVNTLAKAA